jgi:glutamate/tyrosine decarboxylase-like PLP-dependent enzyme
MLGYNAQLGTLAPLEGPTAWGHITCGGTIANMESMW